MTLHPNLVELEKFVICTVYSVWRIQGDNIFLRVLNTWLFQVLCWRQPSFVVPLLTSHHPPHLCNNLKRNMAVDFNFSLLPTSLKDQVNPLTNTITMVYLTHSGLGTSSILGGVIMAALWRAVGQKHSPNSLIHAIRLLLILLLSSPIGNKDRVTPQKTHKQQNTHKIQNTRDKTKQRD